MTYETYKLLHFAGILLTFAALGVMVGAESKRKIAGALHGVGLLFVLVAGFGMLARLGMNGVWPGWLLVKIVVWLVLGATPVLIRRMRERANLMLLAAVALGWVAAWMALMKPIG